MNEKDKADARKLIESIFRNPGWTNDQLTDAVTSLLATTRKEAQADYDYAARLATILQENFYPDVDEWKPLQTLSGVLSQIDNMIAGLLKRKTTPLRSFRIQEPKGPF